MRSVFLRPLSTALLIIFLSQDLASAAAPALRLPHQLGVIRSASAQGPETIIQIEDAHDSLEAQEKIVQILDILSKKYDVRHIALEGSSGDIDPSLFTAYPDAETSRQNARLLVQKGLLNAGEFFAATTGSNVAVYGAEEKTLYRENLKAFRDLLKVLSRRQVEIDGLEKTVRTLSERIYNPEIRDLFAGLGEDAFTKRWQRLDTMAESKGIPRGDFPHLKELAECLSLEKTVSFRQANLERDRLITDLKARLSENEVSALLSESAAYKKGGLSDAEYHDFLLKTASVHGVLAENYPELKKYRAYAARFEAIDIPSVLSEMEAYEEKVRRACLTTDDEKTLFELERTILCL
ncbi:MAG TPA: hypothetical protein VD883_03855, partial [Candidatus Omnitrophota bacterium]|nr:hypothetical protein [Candidatus Omnitrophota bacterium]